MRSTMTTRNHTLRKSGATSLISLLRRCYLAVLAADIPLLFRCFSAVIGRPKSEKIPLITKDYRSGERPEFDAEQRSRPLRRSVGPAERPNSAGPALSDFLLRKIRRLAGRQRDLKHVERVADRGVVAD